MTGDFEASKSVLASESRSGTAVPCRRRRCLVRRTRRARAASSGGRSIGPKRYSPPADPARRTRSATSAVGGPPRPLRTAAASAAGRTFAAGPTEGWLWLAPRRRPTPDRRSAARRSGAQRAHCARSRATPPPSMTAPRCKEPRRCALARPPAGRSAATIMGARPRTAARSLRRQAPTLLRRCGAGPRSHLHNWRRCWRPSTAFCGCRALLNDRRRRIG